MSRRRPFMMNDALSTEAFITEEERDGWIENVRSAPPARGEYVSVRCGCHLIIAVHSDEGIEVYDTMVLRHGIEQPPPLTHKSEDRHAN